MRELKFRAWNEHNKKMLDWNYLQTSKHLLFNKSCNWMQYTGLKDKNDKEIYEGDIANCYGGENYNGMWQYNVTTVLEDITNIPEAFHYSEFTEVIGNIYENPELLKP